MKIKLLMLDPESGNHYYVLGADVIIDVNSINSRIGTDSDGGLYVRDLDGFWTDPIGAQFERDIWYAQNAHIEEEKITPEEKRIFVESAAAWLRRHSRGLFYHSCGDELCENCGGDAVEYGRGEDGGKQDLSNVTKH